MSIIYRKKPYFQKMLTSLLLSVQLGSVTTMITAIGGLIIPAIDPASAAEIRLRIVTVTGRGIVNIPTALAQIRLGVEVQGKTANEVQQEAARRSALLVEYLKSRNVDKLETTGISLNPIYNYQNNEQRIIGYAATNTVSFKIDNKQAGGVIDGAVKAGATRIDGISFTAAESAIALAQQEAIKKATQDAQNQANAALSALNLQAREIVSIAIDGASAPAPVFYRGDVAPSAMNKMAVTPVEGGEQQIQASVTLQISY